MRDQDGGADGIEQEAPGHAEISPVIKEDKDEEIEQEAAGPAATSPVVKEEDEEKDIKQEAAGPAAISPVVKEEDEEEKESEHEAKRLKLTEDADCKPDPGWCLQCIHMCSALFCFARSVAK